MVESNSEDDHNEKKYPSEDDFQAVDIEGPIDNLTTVDCHELTSAYGAASRQAEEQGNVAEKSVYSFLCAATGLHFKPEEVVAFGPMMTMGDKRTAIPDDFRGELTRTLIPVVPRIRNVALRARLADVTWMNSRKADMAKLAWSAYLGLIDGLFDGTLQPLHGNQQFTTMEATQFLARALRLLQQSSKRENALPDEFSDAYKKILRSTGLLSSPVWAVRLVELGHRSGVVSVEEAVQTFQELQQRLGDTADPHTTRHFLQAIASCQSRLGDKAGAEETRKKAAEELVKLAETQANSGMLASHWLMEAITELGRLKGTKTRRDELRSRLRDAQEDSLSEMGVISQEMDLKELVENALERVEDLTLGQALGVYADLIKQRTARSLKEQAKKSIRDFPLSSLFGSSNLDDEGKVVSKSPGGAPAEEESQAQIKSVMARDDSLYRQLCVAGTLEPARRSIQGRFGPSAIDFYPIVVNSPFVPGDAQAAYIQGIDSLLQGDFITAVHVMVPHLEDSIRYILRQHGIETANIIHNGVQEDQGLPTLLERHREKLEKVFGLDLIEEIDRLFLDEFGPKVRHSVAHGKASAYCYTPDYMYACWLIYRIVCLPLFENWNEVERLISQNRPDY